MNNDITIDIEAIRKAENGSITDAETIRQISLYGIMNPGNNDLYDKINPLYQYAGLYPHVQQYHNILPEDIKFTSIRPTYNRRAHYDNDEYKKIMIDMSIIRFVNAFKRKFKYNEDENILNVYVFGSHVYGSNNENSDLDVIIVAKEWFESNDINVHVYNVEQFQALLNRHDIQALECIYSDDKFKLKNTIDFKLDTIDLQKLRVSISTIASKILPGKYS